MKWVAFALILGVFIRHEAVYTIASATGYTPAATFRMLGGAWEALLCAVLLIFATALKKCLWRDLIIIAGCIGMLEGLQTPICRIAISDIKAVPATANLCDYALGFPLSYVLLAIYLIFICWSIGHAIRSGRYR